MESINAIVKKITLLSGLLLSFSGLALAQQGRFEQPVFDEVVCTESIPFSRVHLRLLLCALIFMNRRETLCRADRW